MLISWQKQSISSAQSLIKNVPLPHSSWVEINTQAIHHNLLLYKSLAPLSLFAPVIKSNAYGHGIDIVARVCQESSAVDIICVVSVSEALHVRSLGITKPIVVLSILDNNLERAVLQDIQLTVYDIETALHLNELGARLQMQVTIHIKIDTGLSRLGFLWDQAFAMICKIDLLPHLHIQGIFSHLAESENTDQTFTDLQFARFNSVLEQCKQQDINIPYVHTSCSAALTGNNKSHLAMVRLGISVYGLWPSQENKVATQSVYPEFSLHPTLTWKTKIIQIKQLPAGSYVGYDRTHQLQQDSLIVVLPVGYWDGYDRGLSNKGQVLINNQLAPIVGRIAMNLMMVNATGIDVAIGDQVTLIGNHEALTVELLAQKTDTINYEIVTRINPLLPRIAI